MNRVTVIGKVEKVKKDGVYEVTVKNGKEVHLVCCLFGEKKDKLAKFVTEGRRIAIDGRLAESKNHELYIVIEQLDFLDAPNPKPNTSESTEKADADDDVPF